MEFVVVCLVALIVSALTLFSGFGLGTLLMPAFALFFPVPIAVAATAVVHLANNAFKVVLVGRHADRRVVLLFGLPAAMAAVFGAVVLGMMSGAAPLAQYAMGERTHEITLVKLVIAALIIGFAALELSPRFETMSFNPKYIPLGGVMSGFFGGLSGHQGALRAAFLIRSGLPKPAFVGTMVVSAVVVDVTRLVVYGSTFLGGSLDAVSTNGRSAWALIVAATVAAFAGSFIGARLIGKVTMRAIRMLVGIMLLVLGIALGAGVI
jgi:uncharacterized protein